MRMGIRGMLSECIRVEWSDAPGHEGLELDIHHSQPFHHTTILNTKQVGEDLMVSSSINQCGATSVGRVGCAPLPLAIVSYWSRPVDRGSHYGEETQGEPGVAVVYYCST